MDRRQLITGIAAAGAATLPGFARAQPFPSKPIRIVGGFGAGASSDVVTRLMAPHMERTLGQPIVVDNIVGAAGNIAAATVARARPDGYTLLMATNSMLGANPHLFPSDHFDPLKAFTPVTPVVNIGLVVVAGPASPAATLPAVIDAARGQPVTYGTPGVGTPMHLIGEMLRERSGSKLEHVPYKGGPLMANDLLAGQIAIGIVAYTPVAGFIKAGRLKPLAVCGTQRLAALPDVPTVSELVPGVNMGGWCSLVAPQGTPADACRRIEAAVGQALAPADVVARLTELGTDRIPGDAQVLTRMIKTEYEVSGDLIRRLNIRPS